MASNYRLTNSGKWTNDTWFKSRPPVSKIMWWLLTENCDVTGTIELDIKDMSRFFDIEKNKSITALFWLRKKLEFPSNEKLSIFNQQEFEEYLSNNLENPDFVLKVWIKNYLKHQKNLPLSLNANIHISIINKLKEISKTFCTGSSFWDITVVEYGAKKEIIFQKKLKDYFDKKTTTTINAIEDASGMAYIKSKSKSSSNININSNSKSKSKSGSPKKENNVDEQLSVENVSNSSKEIENIIEGIVQEKEINPKETDIVLDKLKVIHVSQNTIENIKKDLTNFDENKINGIIKNIRDNPGKYKNIDNFVYSAIKNNYNFENGETEDASDRLKKFRKMIGITKTKAQQHRCCSEKAYEYFPDRYKELFESTTTERRDDETYLPGKQTHEMIRIFPTFDFNVSDKTIQEEDVPSNFE